MIDKILERVGLSYNDLRPDEIETINTWISELQKSKITTTRIKDHITSMKQSVEQGLTKTSHNTKKDILLKARLRNYLLLEALLTSPDRAKEQLDQAIAGIVPRKT